MSFLCPAANSARPPPPALLGTSSRRCPPNPLPPNRGGEPTLCVLYAEQGAVYGLAAASDLGGAGADALVVYAGSPDAGPLSAAKAGTDLTVAWVDDTNTVTGTTDIDACGPNTACMTDSPPTPWNLAVIVPQGDSDRLRIATGTHFDLTAEGR